MLSVFESKVKVWMGLTFYPIEDSTALEELRRQLCPFMTAIQKTTESRLDVLGFKELICNEIIETARSNQINNQLSREWYHFIRNPLNLTLESEHKNLIATNLE